MERSMVLKKNYRYSTDELLHLRASLPRVICSIPRINKHTDIANIFRLPYDAFRSPETFCCLTHLLPSTSTRQNVPATRRQQRSSSTEDSAYKFTSDRTDGVDNRQVKWSLRQRNSSSRSSQPYSAPSGIVAQQSENFQRFYRAVISPTHVRVTAGGRIVPNTRSIAPLPFEWDADKHRFEPTSMYQEGTTNYQTQNQNLGNVNSHGSHFVHNGLLSPYPAANQSQNSLPIGAQQTYNSITAITHTDDVGVSNVEGRTESVKIAPQTQFDLNKPFMLQGPMVYPLPHGFQSSNGSMPIPVSMLGNGTLIPSPVLPGPGMFPSNMAVGPMHRPLILPPGSQFMMPHAQSHQQAAYLHSQNLMPPIISISALTQHQLQELRLLLRSIDHQLIINKHQTDEEAMARQRTIVLNQISTMEDMLRDQIEAERNPDSPSRNQSAAEGKEVRSFETTSSSYASTAPTDESIPIKPSVEQTPQPDTVARQEDQGLGLLHTFSASGQSKTQVVSQSVSRLSATAAMAPPFQPRTSGYTSLLPVSNNSLTPSFKTQESIKNAGPLYASFSGSLSTENNRIHTSGSNAAIPNNVHAAMPSQVFDYTKTHGLQGQARALNTAVDGQSIPYLIGTLPAGLKLSDASPTDLTYSRPLTDKEVQARRRYWGKEPRQSGLPKFDGKDFYPPSPVKSYPHLVHSYTRSVQQPAPDFSDLFTEPGMATTRQTTSPTRLEVDYPHLFAVSANNTTGTPNLSPQHSGNPQVASQVAYIPNSTGTTVEPDFSQLFLEPGVPGYREPELTHAGPFFLDTYVTSKPTNEHSPARYESKSETSTIDIHLSPQIARSPQRKSRVPGTHRDMVLGEKQQTQFLQNFLKNQVSMSSQALSGSVTTATAQGHLPNYRGTAAASLSPSLLSSAGFDQEIKQRSSKIQSPSVVNGSIVSVKPAKQLTENRPLSRAIPIVRPPPDDLDAEGYMRLLHNQDSPKTGPVIGSDW